MTVTDQPSASPLRYADAIEKEIGRLETSIEDCPELRTHYRPRWLAIQLLENEKDALSGADLAQLNGVVQTLHESRRRLEIHYEDDFDLVMADQRYQLVHELVDGVLTAPTENVTSRTDRVDRWLTHAWLGLPVLLLLMYVVFNLVQTVSAPYLTWLDDIVSGPISQWSTHLLQLAGAPAWLTSLIVEGVIAGVGGVVVFVPGLLVMYLSLAFLEASGYMARAAFVMDRVMNVLGLQGQSFVPMILGFGCNVPAIYAVRTIENRAARILTGLLIPFMSCSARLPVYVIFGLAFFPQQANLVIWLLYVMGIVVAAVVGGVLSRTLFRGTNPGAFVMEMPSYRWPALSELWRYAWRQTAAFLRKAGTFILAISVLFWLLLNLPWGTENPRHSYFGQFSHFVAPVFEPAGFGNWESSGPLVMGVLAKEVVVSSLAQIHVGETAESQTETITLVDGLRQTVVGFGQATADAGKALLETLTPGFQLFAVEGEAHDTTLTRALRQSFTPLAAFAYLAFILLYVPCMATVGAQIQEFGWRYAMLSVAIMLVVPWLVAVSIYQGGLLLGLG
ncbi:MAG: ferrous iron transport protein B [Chloroflexota bacterium]